MAWAQGVTTLYKFRSLASESRTHTLDIVENSRIYFPSPLQFNDPFDCFPPFELAGDVDDPEFVRELERDEERMARAEGLSPERIAELRASEGVPVQNMAAAVRDHTTKVIREDTRVFCLTSEQRHPLMWSHYASSHSGICLHFRCGPDNVFGLARQVLYVQERKPILIPLERQTADDVAERLVFAKAEFWDYENEYRIIAHKTADWGYRLDAENRVTFPSELLVGITLGMRTTPEDRVLLSAMAAAHRPAIPVWNAVEDPLRFWIEVVREAT